MYEQQHNQYMLNWQQIRTADNIVSATRQHFFQVQGVNVNNIDLDRYAVSQDKVEGVKAFKNLIPMTGMIDPQVKFLPALRHGYANHRSEYSLRDMLAALLNIQDTDAKKRCRLEGSDTVIFMNAIRPAILSSEDGTQYLFSEAAVFDARWEAEMQAYCIYDPIISLLLTNPTFRQTGHVLTKIKLYKPYRVDELFQLFEKSDTISHEIILGLTTILAQWAYVGGAAFQERSGDTLMKQDTSIIGTSFSFGYHSACASRYEIMSILPGQMKSVVSYNTYGAVFSFSVTATVISQPTAMLKTLCDQNNPTTFSAQAKALMLPVMTENGQVMINETKVVHNSGRVNFLYNKETKIYYPQVECATNYTSQGHIYYNKFIVSNFKLNPRVNPEAPTNFIVQVDQHGNRIYPAEYNIYTTATYDIGIVIKYDDADMPTTFMSFGTMARPVPVVFQVDKYDLSNFGGYGHALVLHGDASVLVDENRPVIISDNNVDWLIDIVVWHTKLIPKTMTLRKAFKKSRLIGIDTFCQSELATREQMLFSILTLTSTSQFFLANYIDTQDALNKITSAIHSICVRYKNVKAKRRFTQARRCSRFSALYDTTKGELAVILYKQERCIEITSTPSTIRAQRTPRKTNIFPIRSTLDKLKIPGDHTEYSEESFWLDMLLSNITGQQELEFYISELAGFNTGHQAGYYERASTPTTWYDNSHTYEIFNAVCQTEG